MRARQDRGGSRDPLGRDPEGRAYQEFRCLVLGNPALFDRLRGLEREDFIRTALQVASQSGIALERNHLETALAQARTKRRERLL